MHLSTVRRGPDHDRLQALCASLGTSEAVEMESEYRQRDAAPPVGSLVADLIARPSPALGWSPTHHYQGSLDPLSFHRISDTYLSTRWICGYQRLHSYPCHPPTLADHLRGFIAGHASLASPLDSGTTLSTMSDIQNIAITSTQTVQQPKPHITYTIQGTALHLDSRL